MGVLGLDNEPELTSQSVDTDVNDEMDVNFLVEENVAHEEEPIRQHNIRKKVATGLFLIGGALICYYVYDTYKLAFGSDDFEDLYSTPISEPVQKTVVTDYDLSDQTITVETLDDITSIIIDNAPLEEGKQYAVPTLTDEDGSRSISNGVITYTETNRNTVDHSESGDAVDTSKTLIEERRDAGMDLDQRLTDAKIDDGLIISQGTSSWVPNDMQDVASSSERVLIIGGDVTVDRVEDTEQADISNMSGSISIGAPEAVDMKAVVGEKLNSLGIKAPSPLSIVKGAMGQ